MIKAIIFDFGNVIYKFDNKIFVRRISRAGGKPFSKLFRLIYSSELPMKYEMGLISSKDFYKGILKLSCSSISKEEFTKAFINIFSPIKTTLRLIKKLKQNYDLGLLSNINELHFNHKVNHLKIMRSFDAVTLSFKIKSMKPEKRIFLDMLRKLKARPDEAIYIDDIKEYTLAAKKIGINSIHYTSYSQLVRSLGKFGVNVKNV